MSTNIRPEMIVRVVRLPGLVLSQRKIPRIVSWRGWGWGGGGDGMGVGGMGGGGVSGGGVGVITGTISTGLMWYLWEVLYILSGVFIKIYTDLHRLWGKKEVLVKGLIWNELVDNMSCWTGIYSYQLITIIFSEYFCFSCSAILYKTIVFQILNGVVWHCPTMHPVGFFYGTRAHSMEETFVYWFWNRQQTCPAWRPVYTFRSIQETLHDAMWCWCPMHCIQLPLGRWFLWTSAGTC